MIKELVKIANRLDQLGLTKEADILDQILKFASEDPNLLEEYTGTIEPIEEINFKKLIIEKSNEEIRDIFRRSCEESIELSERILGPDKINYIHLLDPRADSFSGKEIEEKFGEEKLEELSHIYQEYNPVDLLSAVYQIIDDKSMRFGLEKEKKKARSLLSSFNIIADQIFQKIY